MLEERAPARFILLRPLANAENLPITALVHADRNQQRDVAHLAGPTALEHDAVEINIRMVALDRTVAPGLDRPIDLLVEVRHRRGRHPRAPQCLGDVLDPAHRYPGQIHLDQRLFDRALAPPIPLDDGRLERLPAQLRNPQPYLAGLGLQAALVVAGAGIATRLAALIALRIAQPIRLGTLNIGRSLVDQPRTAHDSAFEMSQQSNLAGQAGPRRGSDRARARCWAGNDVAGAHRSNG